MYKCPNCGNLSISGLTQLSPPFDGKVQCPVCRAELKTRMKFSNFLIPIYLIGRAMASLVFKVHFDFGFITEMCILLVLAFFQVRLCEYRIVKKPT